MRLTVIVPALGLCVALTAAAITGDASGPTRAIAGCDPTRADACARPAWPAPRPAPYRLGSATGPEAPVLAGSPHPTSG